MSNWCYGLIKDDTWTTHVMEVVVALVWWTQLVPSVSTACQNCVHQLCISDTILHCLYGCNSGYWGGRCANLCETKGCPAKQDCYRDPVSVNGTDMYQCAPCPEGYYRGNTLSSFYNCSEVCPENCEACSSRFECNKCKSPFYNRGEFGYCSTRCPENCAACLSPSLCTVCKPPYYNDGQVTNCSYQCPNNCKECSDGLCISCMNGYFDTSSSCHQECPTTCLSCSSKEKCKMCRPGYYNGYDMDYRDTLLENCTWRCRQVCAECTQYNSCQTCIEGQYGSYCKNQCSTGCKNNRCDKITGTCHCVESYSGDKCCVRSHYCKTCSSPVNCVECQVGYYGQYCNKSCSRTCLNGCNMESGECNACVMNTYGKFCENFCSTGCDNVKSGMTLCNSSSGHCLNGCTVGFYTQTCKTECSVTCKNGCDIDSGICSFCIPNTYGLFCENTCSLGCLNDQSSVLPCNTSTGICLVGCKSGYFSDFCDKNCSETCAIGCEQSTGYCHSCIKDKYGLHCDRDCSSGCLSGDNNTTKCNKTSGVCLNGCNVGYYGAHCKDECNKNCAGNICNKTSGACLYGCKGLYYGSLCNEGVDEKTWSDEQLAIAVVITCILSVSVTVVVHRTLRFLKSRDAVEEVERKENTRTKEHTVGTYESLGSELPDQMTNYDSIENATSDYANTNV